jgi:hypothetical protein
VVTMKIAFFRIMAPSVLIDKHRCSEISDAFICRNLEAEDESNLFLSNIVTSITYCTPSCSRREFSLYNAYV